MKACEFRDEREGLCEASLLGIELHEGWQYFRNVSIRPTVCLENR